MAQTIRPIATIEQTGWESAPPERLPHTVFDEVSVDDTDFAESDTNTSTFTVLMDEPASAPASDAVTVKIRHKVDVTECTLTVALLEGGTLIDSDTVEPSPSFTTSTLSFTGTGITDWDNVRIKVTVSDLVPSEAAYVSWLYAEVADVATSVAASGPCAHLMTNRCSVVRPTETQSSSSGGNVSTWATVYSSMACAIQGASSSEALKHARETGHAVYDVMFPPTATLRVGDKLTDFENHAALGEDDVLAIVGNPVDESGRGAYLYVPAAQETGEANV